ncbi:MAG: acetate--CoA ligase family protein [Thermomicrobiales bacterium]|nr:acetate--CoA ligase family protein [Thermomicrobiales bacterium]MCO5221490.1 acetate--CoA ligase family protein [Thermomicrobiales bacterium]
MTLQIEHVDAFGGPSLWLGRPVVRAIVSGSPGGASDGDRPLEIRTRIELLDRQLDRTELDPRSLPPLPEQTDLPWLLGWAAIGLQRLAGDDVVFFSARPLESPRTNEVVVECLHRQVGVLALQIALQQLNADAKDNRERMVRELERAFTLRLAPVLASRRPPAEPGCILAAARARAIPITSIDPRGQVIELGHGVYRRRLRNTSTSNSSFLGNQIARDKQLSNRYLIDFGLPAPDTRTAYDAERAVAHARAIGFPVVIKPNDEGNSAGLHLDLRDEDEVRAAFEASARVSRSGTVVVQRYLTGRHYRILVVGDRIVGIAERIAAHVIGDGERSIRELVERENRSPRRGTWKSDRLKTIAVDGTTIRLLDRQGFRLDDVPPNGLRVELQRIDDLELGGEAIIQTGTVHPDNESIIISAVRTMELDIAGVDLVAHDIGQSIWETSGGILEVNCDTGFSLIQFPTSGTEIDPGPAIVETLFPPGAPVRVPLVAVTGERDTTDVACLIGGMLTTAGHATGIALRDGLFLGKTRLSGIDGAGVAGKRRVLLNPTVEMAVLEIPPDEIVAEGLAFEQCDVAVVTSLSGAAPEVLGPAEAVVCRTLAPGGVVIVPAGDPDVLAFARRLDRPVVLYTTGAQSETFVRDRRVGERAVFLRPDGDGGLLEIDWGGGETVGVPISVDIAQVSPAAMAAIAAVLALGLPVASLPDLMQTADVTSQGR